MRKLPKESRLNRRELEALAATADVAVKFSRLAELHPDDVVDVTFHVHAIQNIILARAAYRQTDRV